MVFLKAVSSTKKRVFLFITAIVFLTRVPFLGAGYGTDPDAWRVAHVAKMIGESHQYMASRLPGYPLQELVYAALPYKSAELFNGLTAILSSIGAGVFALLLLRLNSGDFHIGGFALACTPVVFVNSTSTIDYVWALAFILLSLYMLFGQRTLLAGLFLGLAIGCRITSGAMLLPFSLVCLRQADRQQSIRQILQLVLMTLVIGALLFLPVIGRYGLRFFRFSEMGYPGLVEILTRTTVDVFGIIGTIALVGTLGLFLLLNRNKLSERSIPIDLVHTVRDMSMVAIILYGLAYVFLPSEAGYLMPAIPFLLLLMATALPRYLFVTFCTSLTISSCFVSLDSTDRLWSPKPTSASITFNVKGRGMFVDFLAGPVVNDHRRRVERMKYANRVLEFSRGLPFNSIIVAGSWLPQLAVMLKKNLEFASGEGSVNDNGIEFVGLLDAVRDSSRQIWYLPGQQLYAKAVFDIDLPGFGAKEIKF